MSKWTVKGARKLDAKTIVTSVDAASSAEAQALANQSGIVVESVQLREQAAGFSSNPAPARQHGYPMSGGETRAPFYFWLKTMSWIVSLVALVLYFFSIAAIAASVPVLADHFKAATSEGIMTKMHFTCVELFIPVAFLAAAALTHFLAVAGGAVRDLARNSW